MTTLEDLDEINAASSATRLMAGATYAMDGILVVDWDVAQVSNWLVMSGYKELVPIFQGANINGVAFSRLNANLLREIGVNNVGTRLQLMNDIVKVQAISRSAWRNVVVWSDEEYRPNWCCYTCPFDSPCCCSTTCSHLCFGKPDVYTVTNSRLNVIHESLNTNRLYFCPCWWTYTVVSNNTDLAQIYDVDCVASTAKFGEPAGYITVTTLDGAQSKLVLRSNDSQKVTNLLHSIKDEAITTAYSINHGQSINRV